MSRTPRRKSIKGFTLIELLVVVLILAILMAVALPLYLSAVSDSQKKTCRSNMQTIANAVQAYRVKNVAASYWTGTVDATAAANSLTDLQGAPQCPNQGTYSVVGTDANNTLFYVSCTAGGHGTFEPGKDSN